MFELKGRVKQVLPPKTGIGARGPWGTQTIVIEYQDGQYTTTLAIENSRNYENFGKLREGQTGTFKCNVKSREYQGRWFTSVECFQWNIDTGDEPI